MDKDNMNSTFDFGNDPEFNENFYKNIEKALGDSGASGDEAILKSDIKAEEQSLQIKPSYLEKLEPSGEENATDELLVTNENDDIEIDDKLMDINSSLAKQICAEMEKIETAEKDKRKKKKILFRVQSGLMLTLLCIIGFGFFLGFTKPGNNILMSMGINLGGMIWENMTKEFDDGTDVVSDLDYLDDEDLSSNAPEIDPTMIVWQDHPGKGRHEEGVYNVLLLGEEAIGSGDARGRTDVIVIATLNTNNKTVKLTSLMRDTLVQIPGYKDNKLNTAYEKGGLDLLYETIALNFNLKLDGCVMVNFENFEKIIDKLGGLEITLTAGEARYLNSTNYISNPEYRKVKEGKQLLNGNQVLGYSRIRKRATITGNNNDYGRTDRHRIILNAIFDKYKTKDKAELAAMMFEFLPMITTDIDDKNFEALLNAYVKMGPAEMSQLRIPADGAFEDNVKVRGMSVLIPDIQENVEILHSFIFGDKKTDTTASTENTVANANN